MTVEISPLKSTPIRQDDRLLVDNAKNSQNEQKKSEGDTTSVENTVHITHGANDIKRAQEMTKNIPIVDSQRVQAVKQAITNGTYQIKPDVIAGKIIAFEHIPSKGNS